MTTETGWAIAGKCGLYTGWSLTRTQAIAQHVYECSRPDEEISQFASGRGLDHAQKRAWKRRQTQGDRAVKVRLTWR